MKQAVAPAYGTSFSVRQLDRNQQFYKEFSITSALRTQFYYVRYEQLPEESPKMSMTVIEGRGR